MLPARRCDGLAPDSRLLARRLPSLSAPGGAEDEQDSRRVAVLEGEPITQGELDEWIKDELFREQTQTWRRRRSTRCAPARSRA